MSKTIDDKIYEGRQYRDFNVGKFELRAEGEEREVAGYASTFNDPYILWEEPGFRVREQIADTAFDECDMSDVIMQYDHVGRVFARNTNGTLDVAPDKVGLHTVARLGGTTIGRQLYEEIDGGYTTKMSFGFIVSERSKEVTEDSENGFIDVLVTITKIRKLFDVSAVSLPANNGTSISARSFGEGVIAEVREELSKKRARDIKKQKIRILTEV